ncbi:MAG: hypothetical protein ACK566_12135 [Bacteroidota bacterium]
MRQHSNRPVFRNDRELFSTGPQQSLNVFAELHNSKLETVHVFIASESDNLLALRLLNNIATTQIRNINVKLHPVLPFVKNILAKPRPAWPHLAEPNLALPDRTTTIHHQAYSP